MFNSKDYNYCDLQVFLLGRNIIGLRGIEYDSKKAKEALYGAGREPMAIQHGKREYEGTVTVLMSELTALDRAAQEAGYDDCLDLDFDIIVTYLSPTGIVKTDKILQASITSTKSAVKEGDMYVEISLPFVCMGVKKNID